MRPAALLTPHHIESLKPSTREYAVDDSQCKGLRLRILPGGTKTWMIFKRIDGKPRRITLGHWPEVTPDAARLAFYSRAAALEPNAPIWDAQPSTITFAALSARFMEQRVTHFKPSSVGPFRAYVETQLLPNFGNQSIGEITHAHVAAWFHAYSRQRPGGANQALGHFTTIINWGKSEGHLPHNLPNPAAPIRRNRSIARGRMLNFDQICALACVLTSAEGCHWLPAQAIRLCLLTGCRKGEVLSLQWSHVKTNRLILADAKTGPRDVMLNAPARATIAKLRAHKGRSKFVFPSAKAAGGHLATISGSWATLRKRADLPTDIRLHDLRHTYASHAILSGESLPTTGKLLGHASPRTTKRYAHLDGTTLAKAADKVALEIEQMMEGGDM